MKYDYNVIKFLMTTFESMYRMSNVPSTVVESFKANCESLIMAGQLDKVNYDYVLKVYGITNTNAYKPSQNHSKLMYLKMLMDLFERAKTPQDIAFLKNQIENMVKTGMISRDVKSLTDELFFGEIKPEKPSKPLTKPTPPIRPEQPRTYSVDPCRPSGYGRRNPC